MPLILDTPAPSITIQCYLQEERHYRNRTRFSMPSRRPGVQVVFFLNTRLELAGISPDPQARLEHRILGGGGRMSNAKCPFCEQLIPEPKTDFPTDNLEVQCHNCGKYMITDFAMSTIREDFLNLKSQLPPKHIVSGWIRENNERRLAMPVIRTDNLSEIIDPGRVPRRVSEQATRLLDYLVRRTDYYGQPLEIPDKEPAIAYAHNANELVALAGFLVERGLARPLGGPPIRVLILTAEGLDEASEAASRKLYKKAFVAMWFTEEMDAVYQTTIKPAIKETGFDSLVISNKEHNNDINSEIIAEIKQSRFLVADLTGQRGGVYFEAGFALGLGIPVIWTCHEEWFNKEVIVTSKVLVDGQEKACQVKELRRTHFDVEHFPFIIWKTPEELSQKLKNRIRATIEP